MAGGEGDCLSNYVIISCVAELGLKLASPGSAVIHITDCASEHGMHSVNLFVCLFGPGCEFVELKHQLNLTDRKFKN